jgi:uncharacterized protein (TIGR00251 family)
MKIKLKVHVNSSIERVAKISDGEFEVWIKEKPVGGKANKHLEKTLSRCFGSKCKIISGFSSKIKFVQVQD